jgi:hypothetical protein
MKKLDCTNCKNLKEVSTLYDNTVKVGDTSTYPKLLIFTPRLYKELQGLVKHRYGSTDTEGPYDGFQYRATPIKVIGGELWVI